jgi:hypothetical protein
VGCPPPPEGTLGPLGGGGVSCLYEGHTYFGCKINIYFGWDFAWLKYEACFIL